VSAEDARERGVATIAELALSGAHRAALVAAVRDAEVRARTAEASLAGARADEQRAIDAVATAAREADAVEAHRERWEQGERREEARRADDELEDLALSRRER